MVEMRIASASTRVPRPTLKSDFEQSREYRDINEPEQRGNMIIDNSKSVQVIHELREAIEKAEQVAIRVATISIVA